MASFHSLAARPQSAVMLRNASHSSLVAALKQEVLSCSVLHADESPIKVLAPKGDTKRGYIWAFSPSPGQESNLYLALRRRSFYPLISP